MTVCMLQTQLTISALIQFGSQSQGMVPPTLVCLPVFINCNQHSPPQTCAQANLNQTISQLIFSSLVSLGCVKLTFKIITQCLVHYDLNKLRERPKTRNLVYFVFF